MHCRSIRTPRGAGHVTRHLTLWAILLAALSATLAAQTPEEQITNAPWFLFTALATLQKSFETERSGGTSPT